MIPDDAASLRDSGGHADRIPAASVEAEIATKQVRQSKFHFFDSGVARTLSGRLPYPPTPEEFGPLAETFVLNELRAWLGYSGVDYRLSFWRSYDGAEVDVVCETVEGFVAIEIKASPRWEKRFNRGLRRVRDEPRKRPDDMSWRPPRSADDALPCNRLERNPRS